MEIETTRKIKERTFKLSEMKDLKISELKAENGQDEFMFLEENLKDILEEKLKEKKLKFSDDLKVYFSLSYCQGDGFCFVGTIETEKATFKIEHMGNYYHENSKEISLNYLIEKGEDIYPDEFNNRQEKKAEKLTDEFNELYINICKELKKIGYSIIEAQEEENILRIGLRDFLDQNNIGGVELWDIEYKTEYKKGFIKICDSGDTILKGLWIKDLKLKRLYESLTFKPTIRETTEIIFK